MSTEIYLKSKLSNKNGLSKTRNNLIGHTIFLTSEKYRMTNHRPHTKFFTSEKIVSVFPAFRRNFQSECSQLSLPQNHGFRFADIVSVKQFIEDQENENTKQKTQQNVALLKKFLKLKNESRLIEEIPPKELNAYIGEFIITVRKKDNNEDYEPSSLRSLMASFERYLKKKNYGLSIMKDAEFEQERKALQSKQKNTVWLNNTIHFGLRGCKEHRDM